MTNYNTLGHNLKRSIFVYCTNITIGFFKPTQKFIFAMIFGLIAAKSCYLTEIARKLSESITLKKTVERLSRNVLYKGEKILLSKLAQQFKGKYLLKFESQNGKKQIARYQLFLFRCRIIQRFS